MERGLPPFHPLVLSAHAVPGEAGVGQYGLRATVTFDLLGVPGPTDVRLYYDIGGNWGGPPSRRGPELAVWALLAAAVAVGLVMLIVLGIRRWHRRRTPTGGTETR